MDNILHDGSDQVIFSRYTGDEESLVIPEDVTAIADGAFKNNKRLKHIDLSNVRFVGTGAFQECIALESVVMKNVTEIGEMAFGFCRSLRSIAFGDVSRIGKEAFYHCSKLDIPEIPHTLAEAGASAFSHTAIKTVDLSWLEEISPALFGYCSQLKKADIGNARVIGEEAFVGCESLESVLFGAAEQIGRKAFYRCNSLEIRNFPDSLQVIGEEAFSKVKEGTVIPKGIRQIEPNCFGAVDSKKNIKVYKSTLHEFRNYFNTKPLQEFDEDEHFYLWESALDITIIDDKTDEVTGFLPLYCDTDYNVRSAVSKAFRQDNTFDYSVLDKELYGGMGWNKRCKDRLAVMRIKHPFELSEPDRNEYMKYLGKRTDEIAEKALMDKDVDTLAFLCDYRLINNDNIGMILDHSITTASTECTAYLLKYQREINAEIDLLDDEL